MPPRVPRLPAARRSEVVCVGAAGVGVLTPLYLMMPGAEERMARQTAKWAPRWERNIGYFTPRAERTIQRIEPPVARAVQKIPEKLPLEKMAKGMERRIQKGIDRFGPKKH
ncbi:hypothetical protein ESCO_006633 [Escovopsis weberi]|uniref:4-coumarate:coenzyme A ligase n=1 Tax=Escovopsis weberi TaxID=150374 RepID=A0A0M9VXK2_ESCWE|nr:hypothetical protein ESCO_006633 [Escovopsis weberi]